METALGWEAWVTLVIIGLMLVAFIRELARPDLIMLSSLALLLFFGILTPEQAFAGLSNKAVLTVGSLFIIAAGVQNTGALKFTDRLLFPGKPNIFPAIARIMVTTAGMSAFLNNTPIVAMLIPRLRLWCERMGISTSKLMIPLSYAAILGGMTTLIGTSTNLLVSGLLEASGHKGLQMFDLTWVGLPAAIGAILYFTLIGHRLLPERDKAKIKFEEGLQKCTFELRVSDDSELASQSLEKAGLRALKDAYLVHIRRGEEIIPSSPQAKLKPRDVLTFVGSASMLDRLLERSGLEPVKRSLQNPEQSTLPLYEAVISASSKLVGKSLRDVGFRDQYHGLVLGIYRQDAIIEGPLARVPLQAGDLLLIEAPDDFDKRWNQNRDEFYLVAPRRPARAKIQPGRGPLALLILFGVVALAALGIADIVTTAFIGALLMIAVGCLRGIDALRSIDFSVLIVIAGALGLGKAIEVTGLSAVIAHLITEHAKTFGVIGVIAAVYVTTSILTEVITNNAAAALTLAIGIAAAQELAVPPHTFAVAVAIAASASFLTPIGYQTNLMVMAAGGYRFIDYFKAGILVNLIVFSITIFMIWLIWL